MKISVLVRWVLPATVALSLGVAGYVYGASPGAGAPGPQSAAAGSLVGQVVRGPLTPASRPGQPAAAPMAGVKLLISGAGTGAVRSVVSDDRGRYRLDLPAGVYRVEVGPLAPGQFTKDLPTSVTIAPGQETRLDIHIDTGIR
jgi:hypothetical protein